jgi:hypothetical protein
MYDALLAARGNICGALLRLLLKKERTVFNFPTHWHMYGLRNIVILYARGFSISMAFASLVVIGSFLATKKLL